MISQRPSAANNPPRRVPSLVFAVASLCAVGWLAGPLWGGDEAGGPRRGAIIPIHGEIDDIMTRSLQRRIDEARQAGVNLLIFDMDTPGGLVTSALDICRLIKGLPPEIRTVAWVHPQAYSAGAMISLACDEIVMSRSSAIGDCAPIMLGPTGPAGEFSDRLAAKVESPILQEFRDSAQKNGYDLLLARAMVKWEVEVWWIENPATGQRRFIETAEKEQMEQAGTLITGSPASQPSGKTKPGPWRLVESYIDPVTGSPHRVEQPVDRADALLTLSQSDAVAFGFARAIVPDVTALAETLELTGTPMNLAISGWEYFARWLNSPLVRGILFVIMLAGAYIEFHSPGLVAPGVTAVVALIIFLGAPYAAGLADVWTLVTLVIGLLLLAIEILVLPGFGVAGILGLLLIAAAFIGTFVPAEPGSAPYSLPTLPGTWDMLKTGIIVMASSTLVAIIGIVLIAKHLPYSPLTSRMVLANPEQTDVVSVGDPSPDTAYVGDIGVVTGDLRPGGQARFGQRVVDVQSQGEYVEAGTRVQVLEHDGMKIVVRPLPPDEDTA